MFLVYCTKQPKFLQRRVFLQHSNVNITEVLNNIVSQTDINFLFVSPENIIIKEMSVSNQPLEIVLNMLCKFYNLKMTIINQSNIKLEHCIDKISQKKYSLQFFHTNESSNNFTFWNNKSFWLSIENFIGQITKDFSIDKHNGEIYVSCQDSKHKIIQSYMDSIRNGVYKTIEIECVFLELLNEDNRNMGLGNLLEKFAKNYSETQDVIESSMKNISFLTSKKHNKCDFKVLSRQKITILPQQVGHISVCEMGEKSEENVVYGKSVTSTIKTVKDRVINGLSLNISPIIVNNKILCKIHLQVNHCSNKKYNTNKQSNLITTITLNPDQVSVIGDLVSEKSINTQSKGIFGMILGNKSKKKINSKIAILLKGKVLDV